MPVPVARGLTLSASGEHALQPGLGGLLEGPAVKISGPRQLATRGWRPGRDVGMLLLSVRPPPPFSHSLSSPLSPLLTALRGVLLLVMKVKKKISFLATTSTPAASTTVATNDFLYQYSQTSISITTIIKSVLIVTCAITTSTIITISTPISCSTNTPVNHHH